MSGRTFARIREVAQFLIPDAAAQEVAMSDENLLTRREFTVESALAMLAGVTITIAGCGDDDEPPHQPNNNAH